MSTPSVRKGRRRAWFVATLLGAFGLFLTLGAGSAFAASCSFSAGVVTISIGNETAVVSVGNLSHINLNGVWCAPATTGNTDLINVIGTGVADTLVIDESGGYFQPGATTESAGTNEIEFLLGDSTTGGSSVENLIVNGNATPDHVFIGDGLAYTDATGTAAPELGADATAGNPVTLGAGPSDNEVPSGSVGIVNLNGDGDADVFLASTGQVTAEYPSIEVDGNAGADDIEGVGTHGTGAATTADLFITGGSGDDTLIGGDGNDTFQTGSGNDVVDGGQSDEDTDVGAFCSSFFDVNGNPDFAAASGDWIDYSASTGPVTVDLDPQEKTIGVGTKPDGVDTLQNIENINGSPGNDTLSGDNTQNVILGGAGDDTIAGDAGNDCELGQAGNDTFDENEGTSLAQGGSGTDNGADLMLGGEGADDTVNYQSRTTAIDVFLEPLPQNFLGFIAETQPAFPFAFEGFCGDPFTGIIDRAPARQAQGGLTGTFVIGMDGADLNGNGQANDPVDENDCVFSDTENAVTGSGNDTIDANFVGNRADNEFTGNGGNDLEVGGAGNDTFHEGTAPSGADVMDGGTGSDLCDYSGRTGNLTVSLDNTANDGEAGEGDNCGGVAPGNIAIGLQITFSEAIGFTQAIVPIPGEGPESSPENVENVNGGSGNDVLAGSDQGNVLNGNAGNDVLSGQGSSDTLSGGDGDDVLSGGAGNDALSGGNGTDTVDESGAGGAGVGVVINLSTGQLSGDGNDTLSGLENASGTSFHDSIRGDAGNNVLNGRGGNDAIQGLGGDDTINGGDGADELGGGAGNDAVAGGRGNDTLRGGAGADNLSGGPGADTLLGGGGNDVLSGGSGKDVLRGGPGSDRCKVGAPGLAAGESIAGCES